MTYCERLNRLEAERINVTRERTGRALASTSMTAAVYQADLLEAQRRLAA